MPVSGQTAYPVPSSSGGGGGGAPTDAQYLALALDATLTKERRFVAGTGLTGTDGGANGDYTLALTTTPAPASAQYLALATDATLTNERRFVAGTGLTGTDGGAGGDYTLVVSGTVGVTAVSSTPYAVLSSDQVIVVKPSAANITVNLPAGTAGKSYSIKHGNSSAFDVNVVPNGADTIDGLTAYLLTTRQALVITYESGVWHSR